MVALAKAQPGELTFASSGSGSANHMAAELFKSMAGLDIRHIPYKGLTLAFPDLLGGRVTMMFIPTSTVSPLVREGKLRALAVTSLISPRQLPAHPALIANRISFMIDPFAAAAPHAEARIPNVCAVIRFMTRSNLVGRLTGATQRLPQTDAVT